MVVFKQAFFSLRLHLLNMGPAAVSWISGRVIFSSGQLPDFIEGQDAKKRSKVTYHRNR